MQRSLMQGYDLLHRKAGIAPEYKQGWMEPQWPILTSQTIMISSCFPHKMCWIFCVAYVTQATHVQSGLELGTWKSRNNLQSVGFIRNSESQLPRSDSSYSFLTYFLFSE